MYLKKIKIGNSFLIILALYFLGYTHFLGGPYPVAKFFFILILIGTAFIFLLLWAIARFTKNIFMKQENLNTKIDTNETIKVDAKIVD